MSATITPIRPDVRALPHNHDAEQSILGGIIVKNDVLSQLDMLEVGSFYDLRHQVLFGAMRNIAVSGQPIDVVTVEAELERVGKLEAVGGTPYLEQVVLRMPTVDNVLAYAKIVRDHALVREVAVKAARTVERAYGWQYEADELLGEHLAELEQLGRGYREANERIPFISIADSLDEIAQLANTPVFETPFPSLNRSIGFDGLLAGQVYYLAGGTGFGKTSWLAAIVRHVAAMGRWAIVAFWEMFSGYYTAKMAAAIVGTTSNQILRGRVDRDRIITSLPRTIHMLDAPSMSTLRRAAEYHVRLGHGAPLIVVDYLQLLAEQILATMPRPDARLATAQASGQLRELAKATGSAVIVVSAAGRAASKDLTKDVRKRPPRDLIAASRESGSVEFDGAGVIVLSVSDEKDGEEDIATISIAKARFGMTAHIDARFDGRTGEWREVGLVKTVSAIASKPDDGSLRAAIMSAIKEAGGIASKNKIQAISKRGKVAVISEVDAMVDAHILVSTKNGFSLARPPDEVVPVEIQTALAEVL